MENEFDKSLETMFLLKSVDIFNKLDLGCLYQVLKVSHYRRLSEGEAVITQCESGSTLLVLLEGELGVYAGNGRKPAETVKPGEIIGELSIFGSRQITTTIKALMDSLLLEFKREDFLALASRNGVLAVPIIKVLAGRLRNVLEES